MCTQLSGFGHQGVTGRRCDSRTLTQGRERKDEAGNKKSHSKFVTCLLRCLLVKIHVDDIGYLVYYKLSLPD